MCEYVMPRLQNLVLSGCSSATGLWWRRRQSASSRVASRMAVRIWCQEATANPRAMTAATAPSAHATSPTVRLLGVDRFVLSGQLGVLPVELGLVLSADRGLPRLAGPAAHGALGPHAAPAGVDVACLMDAHCSAHWSRGVSRGARPPAIRVCQSSRRCAATRAPWRRTHDQ